MRANAGIRYPGAVLNPSVSIDFFRRGHEENDRQADGRFGRGHGHDEKDDDLGVEAGGPPGPGPRKARLAALSMISTAMNWVKRSRLTKKVTTPKTKRTRLKPTTVRRGHGSVPSFFPKTTAPTRAARIRTRGDLERIDEFRETRAGRLRPASRRLTGGGRRGSSAPRTLSRRQTQLKKKNEADRRPQDFRALIRSGGIPARGSTIITTKMKRTMIAPA